ncbi:hypothetical protein AX16_007901 [Volvariella volvacea WC 439]|nr:hypothetical protein AX16_007901 [Volvariella volvacea WC 439]
MSANRDHQPFSRSSNAAGGPLPLVPRRSSSTSKIRTTPSGSPTFDPQQPVIPVIVTVERPSPEHRGRSRSIMSTSTEDSDSPSDLSDDGRPTITIRSKRQRGVRPVYTPEQSTPTPSMPHSSYIRQTSSPTRWQSQVNVIAAPPIGSRSNDTSDQATPRPTRPLMYTPGVSLRLTTEALKAHNRSASNIHTLVDTPASIASDSCAWPRLVRKKSGQIVKPSLKTSRSSSRTGLSVVTIGGTSKSEPATPTHKAVHFDANLEHVKLFLAEQKPLAVSRDGSPTDDTSGTDSDFPSFIYGDSEDDKLPPPRKETQMTLVNMPDKLSLTGNVVLESLSLVYDGTGVLGRVRVRNLAYCKLVAVRFTFDSWQTTSEVTAKYTESIGPECDRFEFTIRLDDLLARIDGKILHLAVRYSINGQEYWDNNSGNNYLAKFTKVRAMTNLTTPRDTPTTSGNDLSNLHSRLERVIQGKETPVAKAATTTAHTTEDAPPTDASLASRYSWDSALKDPWNPPEFSLPPRRVTSPTPPTVPPPILTKLTVDTAVSVDVIHPSQPPQPPHDAGGNVSRELDESGAPTSPRTRGRPRNHSRSYCNPDPIVSGDLKRTPPSSPEVASFDDLTPISNSRFFTLADPNKVADTLDLGIKRRPFINPDFLDPGSDDLSTPSIISSSSSSRSSSPSPSDSFPFPTIASQLASYSPESEYRQFIDNGVTNDTDSVSSLAHHH